MKNSTTRFSDRVENYVRYRPDYPVAVVETLIERCDLNAGSLVADVGSGTGIFSRQLLEKRLRVAAVEPNREMRQAAEVMLAEYENFESVDGSAEQTNLVDGSVDLICAAQAFHWFDFKHTQQEFGRILKTSGKVALVWNRRKLEQGFQQEYESLLSQHAPEYQAVNHMKLPEETIEELFEPACLERFSFENSQTFDLPGFLGRMQSASYTPAENNPESVKLRTAAESLFAKHEVNGVIRFEYETQLYFGPLNRAGSDF